MSTKTNVIVWTFAFLYLLMAAMARCGWLESLFFARTKYYLTRILPLRLSCAYQTFLNSWSPWRLRRRLQVRQDSLMHVTRSLHLEQQAHKRTLEENDELWAAFVRCRGAWQVSNDGLMRRLGVSVTLSVASDVSLAHLWGKDISENYAIIDRLSREIARRAVSAVSADLTKNNTVEFVWPNSLGNCLLNYLTPAFESTRFETNNGSDLCQNQQQSKQ